MPQITEKIKTLNSEFHTYHYYDPRIVQERFKLPVRPKFFEYDFFCFLHESLLLSFFCLRDKRFRQISSIVFKLLKKVAKRDPAVPAYLKDTFIELDSTFIKIGQFLSSRSDLLPKEYIDVLSELQDSLPPIPFEKVKESIEKELRKPIDKVFKSIESAPIASASIGQVHRAELLNGAQVVIKIQRPDLSSLFYQDLAILRCIATYLERYTKLAKGREWVEIIDEIGKTLFEEIDFIQEGRNADRFRKNLKSEERICIPRIYWQYSTRKLLVIEFVPGVKITDVEALRQNNHDPKELSVVLVNAYFKQFFEDGFYHADPHPGNIVVRDDGHIVFYDFGMVGRVNKHVRKELANILMSVVGNDTDTLLNTLKSLDLIKSEVDIEPLKRVIEQAAYKYYGGAQLSSLDLGEIDEDLKTLFDEKPLKLPSKFTYTLRMTGALEGVCRTLDPNFSLIDVAKPYLKYWLTENLPQQSRWIYLKTLFPNQSKLIDRIKIYVDVIKDLPKYVTEKEEHDVGGEIEKDKEENEKKYLSKNTDLIEEIQETNSRLKVAYGVIFLLGLVFFGSNLIENVNPALSISGFILLVCAIIGSIGIVGFSILKRK